MSLGPGAMMMGRCLQVTSGFTISAEPPLSFSRRPLFAIPGRRRGCRDQQRSLSPGREETGASWTVARGHQEGADIGHGTRGQTSDVITLRDERAASEVSRRNRFINWSFGPAFESRYCCERCPSFAVKSEFPGHHVCLVMMSLA